MTGPMTGPRSEPRNVPRTLVVTGHFPPEPGGVQTFTWEFVRRLPPEQLVVVAPSWPGAGAFDATLPFPVVRRHGYLLFAGARRLVREHALTTAWITAMAPFGLYAPLIRAAGVDRIVGSSHGQEIGWIRAMPTRLAMRAMTGAVDTFTYLSGATLHELEPVVRSGTTLTQLAGGVDVERFGPDTDPAPARRAIPPNVGPVVLSVSRLVRRKGHDVLLEAWRTIVRAHPDARLIIVGEGPMRTTLERIARREFPDSVVVCGPVPPGDLPAYYAAADLFVLPCRDDRRGLQTEGLGLSVLEASASGLPVVVGRSGGSPESLLDGETGILVDAGRVDAMRDAILRLLGDPARATAMGAAGRRWVLERWTWDTAVARLVAALNGDLVPPTPNLASGRPR